MSHKKPKRGGPIGPHRDRSVKPSGLARRIIERRLALGLSQEQAAQALGVARETWGRWELGTVPRGLYATALDRWLKGGRHGRFARD